MALTNGGNTSIMPEEQIRIVYVGQHETSREKKVTNEFVGQALDQGFDMITVPITTSHFQSRVLSILQKHVQLLTQTSSSDLPFPLISPLTPEDTDLTPELGQTSLVAVTSAWIDLASPDPLIAYISRQVLNLEIAYAAFCGINNVLVYGPVSDDNTMEYSRAILEALSLGPYLNFSIILPMEGELEINIDEHLGELARPQYLAEPIEDEGGSDLYRSWETWNTIRTMCNYSTRLAVALELPRKLPGANLQSRWFSEPVKSILLSRTSFLRNPKGFPVLSQPHQQYIYRLLRLRQPPWVLLSDVGTFEALPQTHSQTFPTLAEASSRSEKGTDGLGQYLQYVRHLQQNQPPSTPIERFGQGYQDYLQSPLQPLTDNLESVTYEVFEKDPIKYEWYERAIALALKDLAAKIGSERSVVVAVVGAGRGPLVSRVLLASRQTKIKVNCWAVEKNPNAHCLLLHRNATDKLWGNQVTVVKSDMRSWSGPIVDNSSVKVDLFVSELLGSFADNELSPECLDGAQHLLHPIHGVSIPQSYTAHFNPISSQRLYTDILGRSSTDLNLTTTDKWDIPYVVMLHQYDDLSVQPQSYEAGDSRIPEVKLAWEFAHPISPEVHSQSLRRAGGSLGAGGFTGGDGNNEHNARSCKVSFLCQDRGVCHGLAGYFETVLYTSSSDEKVELSTNPINMETKSKDMISWFPIFFPLKTPLFVPDQATVTVSMWRQTDDRKVWYEWAVEVFETDVRGRKRKTAMSELHSSRKNGCLM